MSTDLRTEIVGNFSSFASQWPRDQASCRTKIQTSSTYFEESYIRISSIQAWRAVVTIDFPEEAEAFFFEAQNDLLMSHCLASCGSFRQALKSLRAAIENVLFFLYYKDHPIELEKWGHGRHRITHSELQSYFESHPKILGKSIALQYLASLKEEYATLSKAVHGSAKTFRMTRNLSDIQLWSTDKKYVSMWATREKSTIVALNFLLVYIFSDLLKGASGRPLRQVLGLTIPKHKHRALKSEVGVNLISS